MIDNKILDDFKRQVAWANEMLMHSIRDLFGNKTKEDIYPLVIDWLILAEDGVTSDINSPEKYDLAQAMLMLSAVEHALKKGELLIYQLSMAMFLLGGCNRRISAKKQVSEKARKNALKAHIENHAIKADAMKYYAENIDTFKSKDGAAELIAGKIVNAKFRTVRQWITEFHKK